MPKVLSSLLFAFLFLSNFQNLSAYDLKYTSGANTVFSGFYIAPNVGYSLPQNRFDAMYNPFFGGGIAIGYVTISNNGWSGEGLSLSYTLDPVAVEGTKNVAILSSLFLTVDTRMAKFLSLKSGFGGSVFKLPDEQFAAFGESTRSELGGENGRVQWVDLMSVGLSFPVSSRFSLNFDYQFMSVERAMMFWHKMISSSLQQLSLKPFMWLGEYWYAKGKPGLALLGYAAAIGTAIAWYQFDYDRHNWPWDDPSPLRYHRPSVSVSFYFGKTVSLPPRGAKEI